MGARTISIGDVNTRHRHLSSSPAIVLPTSAPALPITLSIPLARVTTSSPVRIGDNHARCSTRADGAST